MSARPSILICPDARSFGASLLRRGDVLLRFALSSEEAHAVLGETRVDLVLVRETLAPAVLEAQARLAARAVVVVLLDGPGSGASYLSQGATATAPIDSIDRICSVVSELTGLAFAKHPRAPIRSVIDLSLGGDAHYLETFDVSATGVSVYDFPPNKLGSAVKLRLDLLEPPLALDGIVVRYFRAGPRRCAGISFIDLSPSEAETLRTWVSAHAADVPPPEPAIPEGPTATGDLPPVPVLPDRELLRALVATGESAPETPAWLVRFSRELTSLERDAALGRPPTPWAEILLSTRLWLAAARSRAGARNLSSTEFKNAHSVSEYLSKQAHGSRSSQLLALCEARAALYRSLYGGEIIEAAEPAPAAPIDSEVPRRPSQLEVPKTFGDRARAEAAGLLDKGQIRRAAEVYRAAELYHEAIHLYVNALGAPAEGAALCERLGEDERAAELFELAGDRARAARALRRVAETSVEPGPRVGRILALDPAVAIETLESITARQPLDEQNVELHYLLGVVHAKSGSISRAADTFRRIRDSIGEYKDIEIRLYAMSSMPPAPPPPAASASAPQTVPEPTSYPRAEIEELAREAAQDLGLSALAETETLARRTQDELLATIHGALSNPHPAKAAGPGVFSDRPLPAPLSDPILRAAARVDSLATSMEILIGDAPCSRQNADSFYIHGLAELAAGRWDRALRLFAEVEAKCPGHADAGVRAAAIHSWQNDHHGELKQLDVFDRPSRSKGASYVLRGEIARTDKNVVFCARARATGQDVALKIFRPAYVERWTDRRAVYARLQAVAALRHPNLAQVCDLGEVERRPYVAFEYVPSTLGNLIETRGKLSVVESLRIATQLGTALLGAHKRGLAHGNLRPSNLLRTSLGVIKLTDFDLPTHGAPNGNTDYCSLERLSGRAPAVTDDVFGLGALLYQMIQGRPPFKGLERRVLPPSLRSEGGARPTWLDDIVFKALRPEALDRYQNVAELLGLLGGIVRTLNSGGGSTTIDLPAQLDRRPKKRP